MLGTLLERLRVPCATADSKEAADEIERLRSELAEEKMLKQGWIDEFIKLRDMGSPNLED